MNNRSSQEDPCGHSEIEFKMSVTISRDWTDALKSHRPSGVDCEAVLKEIVSQAKKQNSHDVSMIPTEETWRLEGCFCGIKEIRKGLKNEISKKQTHENSGNGEMEAKDTSHRKPVALVDKSTFGEVEMEQISVGNSSEDQNRSNETPEFQQRKPDGKSNLKTVTEDSKTENSNNAEKEKKGERTVIDKSQEFLAVQPEKIWVTNSGNSEGLDDFKKERTPNTANYSENPKQQVKYPDLRPLMNDNYSEKERILTEVKINQHENKLVTNSHNSASPADLKNEATSKDVRHLENLNQQMKTPDVPTSKNAEDRENLKQSTTFTKSTNSPALRENKTNDPEHDRICALMLLPSVDIDEDIFNYLVRCRNYEWSRIFEKCNLFEPYKVGQGHKLAFEVKPQYDTNSVVADFLELYEKATTSRVEIPEGIDPECLKSLVEPMAEFKYVELRFMNDKRVCKIVGSYWELTKAQEMLLDVIASNSTTSHGFDTTANKKASFYVQMTTTPTDKEPTRTNQWHTASASVNISQPRRSVFTVLNPSNDSFLLSVSNLLTIEVKRDDLAKMSNVDVVVSCINHQLDIDGPMADDIMRAAGPNIRTELLNHKHRESFLPTGDIVHTSAGNLKGVKAIIHVVRLPVNDQRPRYDLKKVFTNCLCYANDVLKLNSICLSPIGFGLYGAEMVVGCFLDAVETFAATVGNGNFSAAAQHQPHPQHLNCIRLVTNDHNCIEQLINCIRRRLGA